MYCDFCKCASCQTGCSEEFQGNGYNPPIIIKPASSPILHTQCLDGRWICDTCYHYECCVDAGKNPCRGLCAEYKCNHRPKLANEEWTFWKFNLGENTSPKH